VIYIAGSTRHHLEREKGEKGSFSVCGRYFYAAVRAQRDRPETDWKLCRECLRWLRAR
jgi:hypothetical protein